MEEAVCRRQPVWLYSKQSVALGQANTVEQWFSTLLVR